MSLSWTPFLNEFFACLLLALLFSCHFLAHVSSLLLGNALFTRCPLFCHSSRRSGSQASLPCRRQSSFIDVIFSGIIQSGHVCPNCWLQLELCSIHGVAAPPHALPRAARPVHAHHTLCLQSSSALGRHSFPSNYNTACLTQRDCFDFLCSFSSTLW